MIKKFEHFNESIIIKKDLEELENLKSDISNRMQRYIYLIESSKDLDPMDQGIVLEKLELLRSDVNDRLDELKQNIWLEK
ncbi:MAG: hypothetical protein SLAVMIC_00071 [uncultured marine phage]|uniref:Uncharacterized protein n=1 Tax=uncultured marine phage TaxID=707152 RepID=A0A8D9FQF7_9VIRU|nr:MAG: hypothetical protein SLAVMIC_00071 [uncultured marine phage]